MTLRRVVGVSLFQNPGAPLLDAVVDVLTPRAIGESEVLATLYAGTLMREAMMTDIVGTWNSRRMLVVLCVEWRGNAKK